MKHLFYSLTKSAIVLFILYSCTKKEIQFGTPPEDSHSRLIKIDTVEAKLSTVILDSFATNGNSTFVLGNYKDPVFGRIEASPFFQLGSPGYFEIPQYAQLDSLVLVLKPNKYYYGDTTKQQNIKVLELAETIDYTYSNSIYNTSNFAVKPAPLAVQTIKIRPNKGDSVIIRLSDEKGKELFGKMRTDPDAIRQEENFKKYFKGIALKYDTDDNASIYGVNALDIYMRLYYHTSIPIAQQHHLDFKLLQNNYQFNRLVADRSSTQLHSSKKGIIELAAEQTNNMAFTQPSTGVVLKTTFPSLRDVLHTNEVVKLLKAVLLIRPVAKTYTNENPLPPKLRMYVTNATNIFGEQVQDTAGAVAQASPQIDFIYGTNTYYRFEVTKYINQMLTNGGSQDNGFFVVEETPGNTSQVNRAVIGNRNTDYKTELVLTILTIDK